MNIRPLHDRLLVRRAEQKDMEGSIVVPQVAKEPPLEGFVVAVGAGKLLEDGTHATLDVKTGDKVLFAKYAGTEVEVDGVKHLLLREEEVLAIIEGD